MNTILEEQNSNVGPIRTLTAALKRSIKQLLGTYSITQIKILQTRKTTKINLFKTREINLFNAIPVSFLFLCTVVDAGV